MARCVKGFPCSRSTKFRQRLDEQLSKQGRTQKRGRGGPLRSAASSSRTEEEATEEEATADAAKEEAGLAFAFARRALTSAGTDAGAAAPQARSIFACCLSA